MTIRTNKFEKTTAIATVLTVLVMVFSCVYAYNQLHKHQESQLEASYSERYDQIVVDWTRLQDNKVEDICIAKQTEGLYYRFWELQYDQFKQFEKDLLDTDIYKKWMESRNIEYKDTSHILSKLTISGWIYVKPMIYDSIDPVFVDFVESILSSSKLEDVDDIVNLQKYGRNDDDGIVIYSN